MKLHPSFKVLLVIILVWTGQRSAAQTNYDRFFTGERLRIDFRISGNADTCSIVAFEFIREPYWGGSTRQLLDTFEYGEMWIQLADASSGQLIWSRGKSSLFQEWQTTEDAGKKDTTFTETILMPYPKAPVKIVVSERRGKDFYALYTRYFYPDKTPVKARSGNLTCEQIAIRTSGSPEDKLDILLIAEGYTQAERDSFLNTAQRLTDSLLTWEPWSSLSDLLNITAVFVPSRESGTDDPANGKELNTALNTRFNTFGSDRYLTSTTPQKIFDLVSGIPYDQLCILVNTPKFGGGAIYNSYTFLSASCAEAEFLLIHEFSHAFAGLADEYYTSSVPYTDFFDLKTEPYQPNISTLVNFDKKWKRMVADTVPVPTPDSPEFDDTIGVFEGAGYTARGIYRPYRTCVLKSRSTLYYCPVCEKAVRDMLLFYTE